MDLSIELRSLAVIPQSTPSILSQTINASTLCALSLKTTLSPLYPAQLSAMSVNMATGDSSNMSFLKMTMSNYIETINYLFLLVGLLLLVEEEGGLDLHRL